MFEICSVLLPLGICPPNSHGAFWNPSEPSRKAGQPAQSLFGQEKPAVGESPKNCIEFKQGSHCGWAKSIFHHLETFVCWHSSGESSFAGFLRWYEMDFAPSAPAAPPGYKAPISRTLKAEQPELHKLQTTKSNPKILREADIWKR